MDIGTVGVGAITVICYLIAEAVKCSPIDNKWLPALCGTVGAIFGIVGFFAVPGFPAGDVISAVAVGAVSGFAATGINQVKKQLGGSGSRDDGGEDIESE